jgi:signal transduction histidine kinase
LACLHDPTGEIGETGNIKVSLGRSEDNIRITIRDNGNGISAADRKRIFEPFFTTKPIGKGTGLGLPIAKNIVAEHKGDIRLESCSGQGTVAVVTLPVCAMPKPANAAVTP